MENTPFLALSSHAGLNVNHKRIDEIRNETTKDGGFPALRSSFNLQSHVHRNYASQFCVVQ